MGRPKGKGNYSKDIEDKVRKLLWDDQSLSGKQLKFKAEDGSTASYSVRTYQSIKEKVLPGIEALKNSDLEKQWTTGSYVNKEYDIPAQTVPLLVEETRLRFTTNLGPGYLTNRESVWFARLYHVMVQIAAENCPDVKDPRVLHGMVSIASREYAYREFSSQLTGETNVDVWDLDYWLLVKKDKELWQFLKMSAEGDLIEIRNWRFEEGKSEPPKIKSFTRYFREAPPEDLEPVKKEEKNERKN